MGITITARVDIAPARAPGFPSRPCEPPGRKNRKEEFLRPSALPTENHRFFTDYGGTKTLLCHPERRAARRRSAAEESVRESLKWGIDLSTPFRSRSTLLKMTGKVVSFSLTFREEPFFVLPAHTPPGRFSVRSSIPRCPRQCVRPASLFRGGTVAPKLYVSPLVEK